MSYRRVVSTAFADDLKHGKLSPLLSRIKEDDTLMLALRDGYINIYYRGGNLLKIEQKGSGGKYIASFDTKYHKNNAAPLLVKFPCPINNEADSRTLVDAIPALKYSMDRYFSQHRKAEREFQQLVARENNCSPISNETEYFIVDIEVAGALPKARFDMLAVRWLRDERKKQGTLVPVLIEMKYGSKALEGNSGLNEHLEDAVTLRADNKSWNSLRKGLEDQINQLDELGLLNFNRAATVTRLEIDPKATPELIFMLANYNPASTKLSKFLATMEEPTPDESGYDLLFFVSSFAGYGMHRACMLGLGEFKAVAAKLPGSIPRKTNKASRQRDVVTTPSAAGDEVRRIVLDTETTGLGVGHRTIEIGCIEMIGRKPTGRRFHRYINPEREVDLGAMAVHGLTPEFLADKPTFREIANELVDFISEAELIIHNAPFDAGFLNYELNLLGMPPLERIGVGIVDTLKLAKKMRPRRKNSLDALCAEYGIDSSHRQLHGALLDAELLAEVYLAMTGSQVSD